MTNQPRAQDLVDFVAPRDFSFNQTAQQQFFVGVQQRFGVRAEAEVDKNTQEPELFERWLDRMQVARLVHRLRDPRDLNDVKAAKTAKANGALVFVVDQTPAPEEYKPSDSIAARFVRPAYKGA